jgi:hypothetical protein
LEIAKLKAEIYNLLGESIMETYDVRNGSILMDISRQNEGIYFVVLSVNDIKTVQRITLIK